MARNNETFKKFFRVACRRKNLAKRRGETWPGKPILMIVATNENFIFLFFSANPRFVIDVSCFVEFNASLDPLSIIKLHAIGNNRCYFPFLFLFHRIYLFAQENFVYMARRFII